jgi:hypothetical protein
MAGRHMGSFYTNIVLRTANLDAVEASLAAGGRTAYVHDVDGFVVVHDQECDASA